MTSVAAPPRYQRRPGAVRPPRASPAPSLPRSRSRSSTPGGPRRCTHCNQPTLSHEEGALICQTCGVVLEQDGNFRAEIEFDETASGGLQTRGTVVRGDQTHQRPYANRVAGASHVGHEAATTSDNAMRTARSKIHQIRSLLGINDKEVSTAEWIFRKAYERQFYRGRTLESVAVVSLYLAVRRARGSEKYALMLIDFAEACQPQLNVFELGKLAKELQQKLYLSFNHDRTIQWQQLENEKKGASEAQRAELRKRQDAINFEGALNLQDPEDLIERFCDRLEFDEKSMTVKRDAVRVAKSMNRDWMTTGRRPAGIAGAAVIIAARMNNFRRTLREVVLVAKVTEITLSKRIEEFKETSNSALSVRDFRAIDHVNAPVDEMAKPPSYYRRLPEWQEKQSKKKKRRRKNGKQPETAAEIENGEDAPSEMETETEDDDQEDEVLVETDNADENQQQAKRPRLDADGFAVPELPTRSTQAQSTEEPPRRKPGRPGGAKNWRPPPPTEAELQEENDLTEDIRDQLQRNASLDPTGTISQNVMPIEQPAPGSGVVDIYPAPKTSEAVGPAANSVIGNTMTAVSMDENLNDDEFEDDPDVANCVLNEMERVVKETIWVTENADWLRTEHAKKIKRELKDRELREKGIDPEKERMKKIRRKDGMQRAGRAGDISYLEEARNNKRNQEATMATATDAEGRTAETNQQEAADEDEDEERRRVSHEARNSVQVMMQQRGTFSRRVDYNKLSQAYVLPGFEDSSESRSESPDPNHFFKPSLSKNAGTSNIRRARQTLNRIAGQVAANDTEGETEGEARTDRSLRVRASSGASPSTPGRQRQQVRTGQDKRLSASDAAAALPTPAATQTQISTTGLTSSQQQTNRATKNSPALQDGSESPLSSTHTPAGYGSTGPATPYTTQRQPNEDDDDDEEDDDDNEDNDSDEMDVDLDVLFGAGEVVTGEAEEVLEEEDDADV